MTNKTAFDKDNLTEEIKERVHQTLDHLISLNRDAVEGFNSAAELLENQQYKEICKQNAQQRERFINELTLIANSYGIEPTDAQSVASVLHEAWMTIRNMISGDDSAVIAECERGEDVAVETYHADLTKTLPDDVDTLIRHQYSLLKGSHERISRLSAALSQ